ncbi:MAG: hypothetical protein NTY38_30075 [Acidobacteria bacterium]|nr:hypothetical protein [Acidobacteriota bacterium]
MHLIRYFLHWALGTLSVQGAAASATFKSRAALLLDNLALLSDSDHGECLSYIGTERPGEAALGAFWIHGELLKVGIDIGETSVGKYMLRQRKSPSQT